MSVDLIFLIVLPFVSFLYAAVGHGGASGYLALMALFSFSPVEMKITALLLNLFVAGISFYHFWKNGYFKVELFSYFAIGSIPLAYIGGLFDIDTRLYRLILGFLLLFAIFRMLNVFGNHSEEVKSIKWQQGIFVGGLIGFFSGLIGIGGGIILSPVILLMKWGRTKETAAVSALFIWVNSASGLGGQLTKGVGMPTHILMFVILAVIGAYFGAFMGSTKLNNKSLRYLLAFVLVLASLKLMFLL